MTGLNVKSIEKVFKKYYGNDLPFYDIRDLRVKYVLDYIEKNGMPVKPGLFELLDYLDHRGIMKAVATSTERKRTEKYLTLAGIRERSMPLSAEMKWREESPNPTYSLRLQEEQAKDLKSVLCWRTLRTA